MSPDWYGNTSQPPTDAFMIGARSSLAHLFIATVMSLNVNDATSYKSSALTVYAMPCVYVMSSVHSPLPLTSDDCGCTWISLMTGCGRPNCVAP